MRISSIFRKLAPCQPDRRGREAFPRPSEALIEQLSAMDYKAWLSHNALARSLTDDLANRSLHITA